jgi:hypothetical protein
MNEIRRWIRAPAPDAVDSAGSNLSSSGRAVPVSARNAPSSAGRPIASVSGW